MFTSHTGKNKKHDYLNILMYYWQIKARQKGKEGGGGITINKRCVCVFFF
jgi:hypothetical protein